MDKVTLKPMTVDEYQDWYKQTVQAYMHDKIVAGDWTPQNAAANAQASYDQLLPQGLATPSALMWTIRAQNQSVGSLWVNWDRNQHRFFIYDIVIVPERQNQGVGQLTLGLLDDEARSRGVRSIGLHVFGGNKRAQHVYAKMGFVVTDVNMLKTLTN